LFKFAVLVVNLLISTAAITYTLPENGQTPVIVYHSLSGMIVTEQQRPLLTVFPDGRIIAGSPSGLEEEVKSLISSQKLQALLEEVVKKNHFFDINTKDITQEITRLQNTSNKFFSLMDSNVVSILITLKERTKKQQFYGLSETARQFPEINHLTDLAAIQAKLNKLRHWILVGEERGLTQALTIANQQLQQKYPAVPVLTVDDFNMATRHIDGKRTVHFQRQHINNNTAKVDGYISVYNHYDKNGIVDVVVTVHGAIKNE